jgi:hypothetical protein
MLISSMIKELHEKYVKILRIYIYGNKKPTWYLGHSSILQFENVTYKYNRNTVKFNTCTVSRLFALCQRNKYTWQHSLKICNQNCVHKIQAKKMTASFFACFVASIRSRIGMSSSLCALYNHCRFMSVLMFRFPSYLIVFFNVTLVNIYLFLGWSVSLSLGL